MIKCHGGMKSQVRGLQGAGKHGVVVAPKWLCRVSLTRRRDGAQSGPRGLLGDKFQRQEGTWCIQRTARGPLELVTHQVVTENP